MSASASNAATTTSDGRLAIDQEGMIQDPSVVADQRVTALEKGPIGDVNAIVLHQTGGPTLEGALSSAENGVGAHFYVDKDGTIYQAASLNEITYHVGKIKSRCDAESDCSAQEQRTIDAFGWNPSGVHRHESAKAYPDCFPTNQDSIGIEVVSTFDASTGTFEAPTTEQTASLKSLVEALGDHYGLDLDNDVYRHPDVSYKEADEARSLVYQ